MASISLAYSRYLWRHQKIPGGVLLQSVLCTMGRGQSVNSGLTRSLAQKLNLTEAEASLAMAWLH